MRLPSPQILQVGKPGLGGIGATGAGVTRATTGALVVGAGVTGALVVGAGETGAGVSTGAGVAHPQTPMREKIIGQKLGSMKPVSP
eukprot:CAMPEP_0116869904 /NCGR_PEP_ID=MMETSP0418-20121206/28010_1 /TAXON_ID=1158023 /ORGANISM="Astrosyne radiata, Strain 13vi08-1A" /LENGTH=85 /DNA_ID=CAMNT_0004506035 /DNA_START=183 /DNA_END=437 /DNA_ORIENTATION=-